MILGGFEVSTCLEVARYTKSIQPKQIVDSMDVKQQTLDLFGPQNQIWESFFQQNVEDH